MLLYFAVLASLLSVTKGEIEKKNPKQCPVIYQTLPRGNNQLSQFMSETEFKHTTQHVEVLIDRVSIPVNWHTFMVTQGKIHRFPREVLEEHIREVNHQLSRVLLGRFPDIVSRDISSEYYVVKLKQQKSKCPKGTQKFIDLKIQYLY